MEKQHISPRQSTFSSRLKDQRGSAAVEFALMLPVLALILFGIIDFGRMLWFKEVLVSATRDGARLGTLFDSGNNQAAIQARVQAALVAGGLAPTNLVVTAPGNPETMTTGQPVTVNSTMDWDFMIIDKLVPAGHLTNTTLQASVTMAHE